MKYNVSIIIPHYNSPALLEKLIKTIPEKEDIQTIVVDDNSTKEVEKYTEIKNKYSYRAEFYQNNKGVQSAGACRNIGLEHAKGQWVIFADADDYFLPNMYEYISEYFQSEYEMVIFSPTSIFLDTGEIADRHIVHERRIREYLENPSYEKLLNVKRMKGPWTKIIRREVIEKQGLRFSETLHHNDMYFVFMVSYYCFKTAVSQNEIYCITRNRGSLTTKVTEKAFDLHVQEYIKCYEFGKEKYTKEEIEIINLNGAILIFEAYKRKLGIRKVIQTAILLRKNGIPLLPKQMKNPIYLINTLIINNKMINREKKYYEKN